MLQHLHALDRQPTNFWKKKKKVNKNNRSTSVLALTVQSAKLSIALHTRTFRVAERHLLVVLRERVSFRCCEKRIDS
jgi:hypothetical protein